MYLEEGVSRVSAPASGFVPGPSINGPKGHMAYPEAKSHYRYVRTSQIRALTCLFV